MLLIVNQEEKQNTINLKLIKSPLYGAGGIMANYKLDITKEHCPMTFVKTKIELSKLKAGDVLEVLLTEGEPLENVPRSATEQGYKVLAVEATDAAGVHKVVIEK